MSGIDFVKFLKEDPHFFVVEKPAKLAVHPSDLCRDRRTLLQLVRNKGGDDHVYPVHRLDKPVSGPVLFARSPDICQQLQQQFIEGKVEKHYVAITRGWTADSGCIDLPLKKMGNGNMQACLTEYECLSQIEIDKPFGAHNSVRYSFVRMTPVTGRFHQLRRHFRDISHPIIGDSTDGDSRQNKFFRATFHARRLMLHCCFLSFNHPTTGHRIKTYLEPDLEFLTILEQLNFKKDMTNLALRW